jgi:hypothetical protein
MNTSKLPAVKIANVHDRVASCAGKSLNALVSRAESNAPPRKYPNPAGTWRKARLERDQQPPVMEVIGAIAPVSPLDQAAFEDRVEPLTSYHGEEHDVFHDVAAGLALKVTKPRALKHGGFEGYLDRIAKVNATFGDDIQWLGWIIDETGGRQLVTSQPWVDGVPTKGREIDAAMRQLGFLKALDGLWYREKDNLWISDVDNDPPSESHRRTNVLVTDTGHVAVIDAVVPKFSEAKVEKFLELVACQPQPEVEIPPMQEPMVQRDTPPHSVTTTKAGWFAKLFRRGRKT